jgi:hypothetical protein
MNTQANAILELRAELRRVASREAASRRRRRRLAGTAALFVAAVGTSLSIAGTGWLTGEAAPPAVVTDFKAYAPQLGFHPEPGKAVLVAQDDPVKLYATTNREGTYCLVVDEPWKHANAGDGGSCIDRKAAASPITAWVLGISAMTREGEATMVVAGRIGLDGARSVRFDDPAGIHIERPLGPSGFYVSAFRAKVPIAVVRPEGVICPEKQWLPSFAAVGGGGETLARVTIPLLRSQFCAATHGRGAGALRLR